MQTFSYGSKIPKEVKTKGSFVRKKLRKVAQVLMISSDPISFFPHYRSPLTPELKRYFFSILSDIKEIPKFRININTLRKR